MKDALPAAGHTDMRRGFDGLALLEQLKRDPHSGRLFVFRGRRGGLIKIIWHDGQGMCLFAKRLERGRFIWPATAAGAVTITAAQLGYLLEGIDWRMPQHTWRPIFNLIDFRLNKVEPGEVSGEFQPSEFHYNRMRGVHRGVISTLLDYRHHYDSRASSRNEDRRRNRSRRPPTNAKSESAMTTYRLHYFPESGNSYKLALMLTLCGQGFESVWTDFGGGVTRTEEWRAATNAMGEIPVLEDGGVRLTQTAPILLRLSARYGQFGGRNDDEQFGSSDGSSGIITS